VGSLRGAACGFFLESEGGGGGRGVQTDNRSKMFCQIRSQINRTKVLTAMQKSLASTDQAIPMRLWKEPTGVMPSGKRMPRVGGEEVGGVANRGWGPPRFPLA